VRTRSYDWIAHHAATRGDKLAMRDLATGRSFSYAEMNDRASRLASALRTDLAVTAGDRVVVLAENNTNFFVGECRGRCCALRRRDRSRSPDRGGGGHHP